MGMFDSGDDLTDFSSVGAEQPAVRQAERPQQQSSFHLQQSQAPQKSTAAVAADFLGFGSSTAAADESFLPESPPAEPSGFNMDSQPAAHPAPPPAATSSKPAAPRPAAPSSMIDFGDEAAMLAQNSELYQGLEAVEGEPELRKQLREKRLREMHQRMQAQLAEKQARDAAESDEKEQKVDLGNRVVKPKIDAWRQSKKDNIRALLSTLHTVLWEGSGWNPPNMTIQWRPTKSRSNTCT